MGQNRDRIKKFKEQSLKRGKRGISRILFSRTGLIILVLFLQVVYFSGLLIKVYGDYQKYVLVLVYVIEAVVVIYMVNSKMDSSAKITWLVIILVMPLLGCLFYIISMSDLGYRRLKKHTGELLDESRDALEQDVEIMKEASDGNSEAVNLARYLNRTGSFPLYKDYGSVYYSTGKEMYDAMIEEIKKAKEFVFLEFFIIANGYMWGTILDLLEEKVREGVEVRLLYDGMNEVGNVPRSYYKSIEKLGIKCKSFMPLQPFISTSYNYRDHRKIVIIDGKTAFNGGINLADEYINHINRFGHWKDAGVKVEGPAVDSFTLMFLQMWDVNEDHMENVQKYIKRSNGETLKDPQGYLIPYADTPVDEDRTGENVYIDILYKSKEYCHIMTPYLILDDELKNAIVYAASRGLDVCIILPGIPDKKFPYAIAKTYYKELINAGVRIYEYSPGFIHSKVFVSDNERAVVGTINLDYRSLYHHFECATYLENAECISNIEDDFQKTRKECKLITNDTLKQEKLFYKVIGPIVRIISTIL